MSRKPSSDPDAGVPIEQVRLAKEEAAAWDAYGFMVCAGASPLRRRAAFGSALRATARLQEFEQSVIGSEKKAA